MPCAGFVGALTLAAALFQAPAAVPRIGASVQVVHVEVMVTDKRSAPVRGLSREDFVLYDDGTSVPIVAFQEPAGATGERAVADDTRVAAQRGDSLARSPTIVVYLDHWNLTPGGLRRTLPGLTSLLRQQLAGGRVQVLVLVEDRGTRALTGVTRDFEEVARALAAAERTATHGLEAASGERWTIEIVKSLVEIAQLQRLSCRDALAQLQQAVRQHAGARMQEVRSTISRLSSLVVALGALPGSKALVYISEGLEQRPGTSLFYQLGDICPEAQQRDYGTLYAPMHEYDVSRGLQEMSARANAARVTVYPLDASGLRTFSVGDPSQADRRYTASPQSDAVREANLRSGQWIVADATGGFPVFNTNNPATGLHRLTGELYARYSLGFTPSREPDGRSHVLRVELRRKGLRVRHRTSYLHADRGDEQVNRTLATLLFGYREDTLGAEIGAEVASITAEAGPLEREVSVRISLSASRLTAGPGLEGRTGRLRVVMAVRRTGSRSEPAVETREKLVDVELGPESGDDPEPRREIVVRMPLARDGQEIAVGIQDAFGSAASYRKLEVRP
jgi:VWFA-related protein